MPTGFHGTATLGLSCRPNIFFPVSVCSKEEGRILASSNGDKVSGFRVRLYCGLVPEGTHSGRYRYASGRPVQAGGRPVQAGGMQAGGPCKREAGHYLKPEDEAMGDPAAGGGSDGAGGYRHGPECVGIRPRKEPMQAHAGKERTTHMWPPPRRVPWGDRDAPSCAARTPPRNTRAPGQCAESHQG